MQIRLHKLLVQVHLVETSRPGILDDVQVVEAGDLPPPIPKKGKEGKEREGRQRAAGESDRSKREPASLRSSGGKYAARRRREKGGGRGKAGRTFLCPLKWCKSLISLKHRLERIFLEKMFVI